MTEFFEVISKSACHIYHSALQLTPHSSIIWKLYNKEIYSPVVKVVTGIPTLWDSCTAIVGATERVYNAVWSLCGQFIAASFGSTIEVRDSNTLERTSVLKPPDTLLGATPISLTFSPNGSLLACSYYW